MIRSLGNRSLNQRETGNLAVLTRSLIRCGFREVLELGQVQLIRLISWAVYEEAAPALRCLSVLPLRCMTSGSDGVDQRLEVNQFEPIPGLNLWADSSASLQPSESCPPSQHLPFGPSRQPRQVKLTTLSLTPLDI
ncbi:hypothetical protein CRENBAI_017266 [Crenichthys baileyi]|uniref:Uncharacterized protein n=1 Tax=Crenichthys baileyi TaxID=28760 RepID=A0AAV9R2V7_9TELE